MTPFNPQRENGKKLVYCTRKAKITPAKEIWPHRKDAEGVFILVASHYVHDEWHAIRTSKIIKIDGNDIHTLNSIYRVVDGSIDDQRGIL